MFWESRQKLPNGVKTVLEGRGRKGSSQYLEIGANENWRGHTMEIFYTSLEFSCVFPKLYLVHRIESLSFGGPRDFYQHFCPVLKGKMQTYCPSM